METNDFISFLRHLATFSLISQTQGLKNKENKFLDQNWVFENYRNYEGWKEKVEGYKWIFESKFRLVMKFLNSLHFGPYVLICPKLNKWYLNLDIEEHNKKKLRRKFTPINVRDVLVCVSVCISQTTNLESTYEETRSY